MTLALFNIPGAVGFFFFFKGSRFQHSTFFFLICHFQNVIRQPDATQLHFC